MRKVSGGKAVTAADDAESRSRQRFSRRKAMTRAHNVMRRHR